ncbi:MAG: hypothetical protein WC374_02100 [Phycisphaerae bacterium]|jgi:hypothetical protein
MSIDEEKNNICDNAEQYYLGWLLGEDYGNVPEQIKTHLESCGCCKSRLDALKKQLSPDASDSSESLNFQIRSLECHFAYFGKKVDCAAARRLFPSILKQPLEVKIPTPITVHIDHCDLCKSDLATIRSMSLPAKQLDALSSILGNDSSVETVECSVAASAIKNYVELNWDKIEPDVVKHLCCCSSCQSLIYKLRAETIKILREKNVQSALSCDSVTFSDVFDCCYPYVLAASHDQYVEFKKSFADEFKECADYLQKIQDLHQLIYAIKQRPNSGIITICELDNTQKSQTQTSTENKYEGFPVKIKTIKPIKDNCEQRKFIRKSHHTNQWFNYTVKAGVAACIVFAVSLLLHIMPAATALTIQKVYEAIQNASNVHIRIFSPENNEPLQEKWASKSLGIYALKDENGFIAWDVPNKLKIIKLTAYPGTEIISINEQQSALIQKRIQSFVGFMPFEDISQVPPDAEWMISNDSGPNDIPKVQIYELSWTKQMEDQTLIQMKWRGFVEKSTNRPLRTEFYRYNKNSNKFELETLTLIEYCTENQIKDLLQ